MSFPPYYGVDAIIILPILQMRKPSHRKVKRLAQISKGQSPGTSPQSFHVKATLSPTNHTTLPLSQMGTLGPKAKSTYLKCHSQAQLSLDLSLGLTDFTSYDLLTVRQGSHELKGFTQGPCICPEV